MNRLLDILVDLIRQNGPLSVADYMGLALQHPEYGYYRHGNPLGRQGDFITAPEISQMFGEMIGLWCVEAWTKMGSPPHMVLAEFGPGRGTLLQDALRATTKVTNFHNALDLYLCESNQTLRNIQREKLSSYVPHYIEELHQFPPVPTLIIANEFFDALPIHQFERNFLGWGERLIDFQEDQLVFTVQLLEPARMALIPADLHEAPVGTIYEVSRSSISLMHDLTKHLVKHGGAFLTIDYGYVEPNGQSTLQAVAGHRHASVLEKPGEIDLTALVDFSALRRTAELQKGRIAGPVGQGDFLKNLGIEIRAAQLKHRATASQAADIDLALHRLTDSSQMGSLFKVMAVSASPLSDLPGF